ncbi:MAG: M1 family metallopeptidase [Ginsengibacter sp.]
MKKIFFAFIFFQQSNTFSQSGPAPTKYFQQQVNYKIDVTLNDADNTLTGAVKIGYTNNSPDTLNFIWFHLWPNAYKNDKTDFSDQLLENGRTDFYFSGNDQRGYINRLDFKVNGNMARLEDHPQYFDVVKLMLPSPLLPGVTIEISSPFHEKLPNNFSRGGHVGQSYQVTQWYPKPAVYDEEGWHPIPYLDQGEFYSEFGNFDVQITLPKNYVLAATGELQNEEEKNWLLEKSRLKFPPQAPANISKSNLHKTENEPQTISSKETKTLRYLQKDVHDFAWFADKSFIVRTDTLQLRSGRIVDAYSFFTPSGAAIWKNSIYFIKEAVRTRSEWLGEYPYNVVTALEARMGFDGGMEYPMITSISPAASEKDLDLTIEHEVGHNWNYGILASNERQHPWMDEGMNTYFDNRYIELKYPGVSLADINPKSHFLKTRVPTDPMAWLYQALLLKKTDQPIETSSEKFSEVNYNMIAYYKTGKWMKLLEDNVGKEVFDSSLHTYFERWKFKHPRPADFKLVVEEVSGKNQDSIFNLLNKKGPLVVKSSSKNIQVVPFFSFKETTKRNYIFVLPALGINYYDKLMVGIAVHNYTIPSSRFQFFVAPMYATGSKKFTGFGRIAYNRTSYGPVRKAELSVNAATFSTDSFTDSATIKYLGFSKIVPSLKMIFRERNPRSTITKFIQWKTFFIREDGISFFRDTVNQVDLITYPRFSRFLNQLRYVVENNRVLYPYKAELMAEQGKGFVRTTFTGNYFFNYPAGGGAAVRLFAGKFSYVGDKTLTQEFETDRYHLNMSGAKGYEDYTYSNYFTGRNEFDKFSSQQMMIKDGGFKVRTDLLATKIGKTDDWLAALNFKTDIPAKLNPLQVLPVKIPLRLFFDAGTSAEAWKKDPATGKFIFDGGLQVSLVKDLVNIYIPVIYSKVYADYFKSTLGEKRFWKNISFSIDIQNFDLKKFIPAAPL